MRRKKVVRKFVKNRVQRETKKLQITKQTEGIATQLNFFAQIVIRQ